MLYFVRYRDNMGASFGYEKTFTDDSFYTHDSIPSTILNRLIQAILPKDTNNYDNPTHSVMRVFRIMPDGSSIYFGYVAWIGNDLLLYRADGSFGYLN